MFWKTVDVIWAYKTPLSQMEKLDRGLVVVPTGNDGNTHCILSWRLLGNDPNDIYFNIQKNGVTIADSISDVTFYDIDKFNSKDKFRVIAKHNNEILDVSEEVMPWNSFFMTLHLDRPENGVTPNGRHFSYSPNDCSVGDVDGDGDYELFVKWDPDNSHDNSHTGYTGNVYIDCYKLNGTKLWRIDLGQNIRAGAHYTQFLVYDFNADGKAEMICKTASGSKDGLGQFVSNATDDMDILLTDNNADYRNRTGMILDGPEFLTVFEGLSGKAINTVYYNPNRAGTIGGECKYPNELFWGDSYGNRSERYLACVAYLDGSDQLPAAVFTRGYYTRAYLWAVKFLDNKIVTKWLHNSESRNCINLTNENGLMSKYEYNSNTFGGNDGFTCFAQGAHSIAVGDVDCDDKDEIMFGGAAVDDDGQLLYSTGLGHGDATHLADLDPDRPGLEFFMTHEHYPYGFSLRDAATGEILYYEPSSQDNGRGLAADIDPKFRGYEFWSIANWNTYNISKQITNKKHGSINFRIYWDDDPYDELFDRSRIDKWNGNEFETILLPGCKQFFEVNNSRTCNGTKSTPNLIADIFGDWREEVILWDAEDKATLNIFTTTITPQFKIPTLMHDHIYRMSICWQNVAYNQPPHLGYYLPDSVANVLNKN